MRPEYPQNGISNVHAAALLLGAAGLLSRLLGVIRDRLLASEFGAGRELDIYYAAFQIPDFMWFLFLLGAASSAIIPVFQENLRRDRLEAERLISALSALFVAGAASVSIVIFFAAPLLVAIIAPGFDDEARSLASTLTRLMILSPILLGLSSIFSAVVQSFQRFVAYALAPILYNIGIIAGIVFLAPVSGVVGVGAGVILGAALHMTLQLFVASRLGFSPFAFSHFGVRAALYTASIRSAIRRVFALSFPGVLSASLLHVTMLVLVAIASTFAEGSIAVFTFAHNLYFLPIGIFGLSYAVAVFPRLSSASGERDAQRFFEELFSGIRTIFFWLMPSAILFIVLRAHIVRVALGAGEFTWEDTRLVAATLAALAAAMVAGGLTSLLVRGFYALGNTWPVLIVNSGVSIVTIALAFGFSKILASPSPLRDEILSLFRIGDLPHPDIIGLAIGFAAGLILNAIVFYLVLHFHAATFFSYAPPFPLKHIGKIIVASVGCGVVAYVVRVNFSETLPLITFFQVLLQGALSGIAGLIFYFGLLTWWGSEDIATVWESVKRRLIRIRLLPQSWDGEENAPPHV